MPPKKKARKVAPASAEKVAHRLIDLAKSATWEELYKALDSHGELVNHRPEVRAYGILHQAAYHGDAEVVSTLIDKYGADLDMRTKDGLSVREIAEEHGHAEVVALVSSRLATASVTTAFFETPEKVARPADNSAIDGAHRLIDLARDGAWKATFRLLDGRRDLVNLRPEVREFSALHQAAFHGASEVLRTLVDKYGADPCQLSKSGKSAADIAEEQGHHALAAELRAKGDSDDDMDMVQMADGSWKVVQKKGSGTNVSDGSGACGSSFEEHGKSKKPKAPATASATKSATLAR